MGLLQSPVTSVDFSRFPALTYFKDTDTQLKQVSFRNNPQLRIVTFIKKPLASLDMSSCARLEYLYCEKNRLTPLNVSNNTASGRLGCSGNQLTTRM